MTRRTKWGLDKRGGVIDYNNMASFNQKGVAHILVLVILVVGLVAGLYLVQHPQIFKPRAYDKFGGGPISRPISGPIVCKEGLNSFAVESPCGDDQFAGVTFQCHDGQVFNLGSKEKDSTEGAELLVNGCKTSEEWSAIAKKACQGRSSCKPKKPKDNCPPASRYCPTTNGCLHVSKICPTPTPEPLP